MLNVKHQKAKREMKQMLISTLAGIAIGEGVSKLSGHEYSPRVLKKITRPTCEMLQDQYCVTLVSAVLFTNVICRAVIPRAQSFLMNRKGIFTKCIQTSLSIVGIFTFSSTFVLATVIYVAKRNTVLTFLKGLQNLYLLLKEFEAFISESLSDPFQVVEKFSVEIAKELDAINEVAQAMMFDNELEAIKEIDQEISFFEEHLKAFEAKMPEFKLQLDVLLKKIQKSQEELSSELSKIEIQSKKLEELVREIDYQSQGFCEGMIKKCIDFDKFKKRKETFQKLFEEGINLSRRALSIINGLHLIGETNSLEGKAINVWFSIVEGTHLPMIQDMTLTALSIPIIIKELGRAYMHNQFRRDAFFNFKAKRIILCKKYPDDVAEFRDGLVHLRHARTSIFEHLNQMTILEPLSKGDWMVESGHITKGGSLLQKSSWSLQEKIREERGKRGFIKTFIV